MLTSAEIDIRSLHSIDELNEVRTLESKIWGEYDSIPTHQTVTAVKNGGLVLGAYFEKQLVGFQYSFAGYNGKEIYLCSHVLGTDPRFRNLKIGEKLKLAQREEARKLGYTLITWTYDPLESVNGYLNIGKLGSVCSTYIPDCYGEMEDLLNNGIPSDRFLVEWYINLNNTRETKGANITFAQAERNSLIRFELHKDGYPIPKAILPLPMQESTNLFVPIPSNFRMIREINKETAMEWRLKTREVFTNLFREGWEVTGFKKTNLSEVPIHFYILSKKDGSPNKNDLQNENYSSNFKT
jgi:predicted GNAT superfamily acetyltransferase